MVKGPHYRGPWGEYNELLCMPHVVGSLKYFTQNINIWALFYPLKTGPFQKNLTHLIFSRTVPLSPQKQSKPLSLVFECAYILASETSNEKDERYIINKFDLIEHIRSLLQFWVTILFVRVWSRSGTETWFGIFEVVWFKWASVWFYNKVVWFGSQSQSQLEMLSKLGDSSYVRKQ